MARSFQTGTTAVATTDTMATRFENMLNRVKKMIDKENIYSVWIKLSIGKSDANKIIFDTSSTDKDENLMMSLDYEKVGAGQGNEFTFKVAFDLFNYGQDTKKNVEKLDDLLYKALNINNYSNAIDIFYCNFQYGYNVVGDTQIVSPYYEGLITEIVPSIDYSNGKTYYTIKGTSFIANAALKYTFDPIADGKNGLELVKETLWTYHGNPNQASQLGDSISGITRHSDVEKGISAKFNIEIPDDLMKSASKVYMETMSDITPIDYCKEILRKTVNTSDSRYNGDDDDPGYDLKDGDFKPYYTLYLTDSGGNGIPTVHIAYVGTNGDLKSLQGIETIDFEFEWFSRTNNLVIGWKPQVDLMSYFLAKAEIEHQKSALEDEMNIIKDMQKKNESSGGIIDSFQDWLGSLSFGKKFGIDFDALINGVNNVIDAAQGVSSKAISIALAQIIENYQEKIAELSDTSNIEYYQSTLTLIGIPSDIPLNILLNIKPKIFESVSRTQGQYYVLGAKDSISTSGLFTTTIDLLRYKNG